MPARLPEDTPFARASSERRTRAAGVVLAVAALAVALAALPACSRPPEPVRESRDALGTIVTVTAYAEDEADGRRGTAAAFDAMAGVEQALDAHEASSAVAVFNERPFDSQPLPADALLVFDAVERLGVEEWFSPALLGVVRLYDFEGGGRVPSSQELEAQVALSRSFRRTSEDPPLWSFAPLKSGTPLALPGLDFGGAAKGLAIDVAAKRMREADVGAALLSAGSTTLAYGEKPDGEPWRVGVEDPRDPEEVVATVRASGDLVISTSGDYQRFFERDGVRYHHIIDPRTGVPARGLRSLTVLGEISALDSDVLSTALFVAGLEQAESYAREHSLGLVTVDDEGVVRLVQPPQQRLRIEATDG